MSRLLQENIDRILQETGDSILLEQNVQTPWTHMSKNSAVWTKVSKSSTPTWTKIIKS